MTDNYQDHLGYKEDFIGTDDEGNPILVPLPQIKPEFQHLILDRPLLRDGYIADYVHFSLVMNRQTKQAFFSAANLDQNQYDKDAEDRTWQIDHRIGAENQIPPSAYKNNNWDQGHLTRMTAVTWGDRTIALKASRESCYMTNACFQHEKFNRDEWRKPERVAQYLEADTNGKLCILTGPVFTKADRYYEYGEEKLARIPSAFWKVICFKHKDTGKLATRAYLMPHDKDFILESSRESLPDLDAYQVTTTELEEITKLDFSDNLRNTNPLLFHTPKGPDRINASGLKEFKEFKDELDN